MVQFVISILGKVFPGISYFSYNYYSFLLFTIFMLNIFTFYSPPIFTSFPLISIIITHKVSPMICSGCQCQISLIFQKITNKAWYFVRIVCWQTILMKYHTLFLSKIGTGVKNVSPDAVVIGALSVKKSGNSEYPDRLFCETTTFRKWINSRSAGQML